MPLMGLGKVMPKMGANPMGDDDRKLTYSERDKLRRDGDGRPQSGRARAAEEERSHQALKTADSLFVHDGVRGEGKALIAAVQAAHGSSDLPAACQAYFEELGAPQSLELISIFLDAGEKALSVAVLDELLRQKASGSIEPGGGLKRQLRILSEDFDDDLASRAEEFLE
jgi:hypothetical protein